MKIVDMALKEKYIFCILCLSRYVSSEKKPFWQKIQFLSKAYHVKKVAVSYNVTFEVYKLDDPN